MMETTVFNFDTLFTFNSDPCFCNGNGNYTECQIQGFCSCNEGWTGRADFNDGKFSCQINNNAIIALWALNIFAIVIAYLLSLGKVRLLILKFQRTRDRQRKKGKSHKLSANRGLIVLLLLFFFVLPIQLALSILRIADSEQRVGLSIPFTILWSLLVMLFAIASHRYTTAVATAMLRAEVSTNNYIARGRWFGRVLSFVQSLPVIFAYPVLITGGVSKELSRACTISYLVLSFLVYLIQGFWIRWVDKHVYFVLTEHGHLDLRTRMQRMLSEAIRQAWFTAAIFAVATVIPVLWITHDYYLPIIFISIPILSVKATDSIYVKARVGATTIAEPATHLTTRKEPGENEVERSEF